MAYSLVYADGSRQPLTGRVAITRQDNDITKPDTVQAAFSTSFALPDDVATHKRLDQPQLGTSLSEVPYQGAAVTLEASGVEVLPGARLSLDDYTPRTGYSGKLLGGNKAFYDLLGDKLLRDLDLSAFDHEWTLASVAAGAGHTSWPQGYVYDLYDRGLGAPPLPSAGRSKVFERGYWPTTYARAVWEAIFRGAGVTWNGELPTVFDTALLPAPKPYGYSDTTREAYELVAGYRPTDQRFRTTDEQNRVVPYAWVLPWSRTGVDNKDLHKGDAAVFDPVTHACTIQLVGYYDLRADQDVHIYCFDVPGAGEVSAAVEIQVNGVRLEVDSIRGRGNQDASLTALAERVLLQPGDVVQARYLFDKFDGSIGTGPGNPLFDLLPNGRLTVQLLAEFPPRGRVHLADWLPNLSQKDFVKGLIQAYGLTQTTDPYTGAVTFRRTAQVLDALRTTAADWSARRDGSQPAKRSWKLGDFALRNWFRWKEDGSNTDYQKAQFEQSHAGQSWDADGAKAAAAAFAAGYLDNGAGDVSLAATKDVLTLPFAATLQGVDGLLLVPCWKPNKGTDYEADLAVIAQAEADGTYTHEEAEAARAKALVDDFEMQEPQPRLVYQLPAAVATRGVQLVDDHGATQTVAMRLSYFVDRGQGEDLDFSRCLLPLYYPHLAAALVRPLVLRPYVYLTAAEVVAFDQLRLVWLADEGSFFYVNKVDGWEDGSPSTAVELVRV